MPDPSTITTCSSHGIEPGSYVTVSGKTFRIVAVPTSTTMVIDRPWWLPLYVAWGYVCAPFWWARYQVRAMWWRVLGLVER